MFSTTNNHYAQTSITKTQHNNTHLPHPLNITQTPTLSTTYKTTYTYDQPTCLLFGLPHIPNTTTQRKHQNITQRTTKHDKKLRLLTDIKEKIYKAIGFHPWSWVQKWVLFSSSYVDGVSEPRGMFSHFRARRIHLSNPPWTKYDVPEPTTTNDNLPFTTLQGKQRCKSPFFSLMKLALFFPLFSYL